MLAPGGAGGDLRIPAIPYPLDAQTLHRFRIPPTHAKGAP